MKKVILHSIHFENLKGLQMANIEIKKPLTAIMGVNGCGKTTVLHAMACIFQPESDIRDYKFSNFFIPNSDSTWQNSKFSIIFSSEDAKTRQMVVQPSKVYRKNYDRWAPRYENRPIRDTYYLGIDTCLPEIELTSQTSMIKYKTEMLEGRISEKVCKAASFIMNKPYQYITKHITLKKELIGVRLNNQLTYSSLSMGTGEQRILKILQCVYGCSAYSFILIDEIDLLLHVTALRRLMDVLNSVAIAKHLQIVFTTHSTIMDELKDIVSIQYLEQTNQKTIVYDYMNSDMIYALSGTKTRPISVYMEDDLSRSIVFAIADELGMRSKIDLKIFGSISNAFTLSAGMILKQEYNDNTLIITDGDRYKSNEEKLQQIQKVLSGTEMDIEERQEQALSLIIQYVLPDNISPEKYIFDLILESSDVENEIVQIAHTIHAVQDEHQWVNEIINRIGQSKDVVLHDIMKIINKMEEWVEYTAPIRDWLLERKSLV
jgi:predicted ATP-dependent endonuclease of OLD family